MGPGHIADLGSSAAQRATGTWWNCSTRLAYVADALNRLYAFSAAKSVRMNFSTRDDACQLIGISALI